MVGRRRIVQIDECCRRRVFDPRKQFEISRTWVKGRIEAAHSLRCPCAKQLYEKILEYIDEKLGSPTDPTDDDWVDLMDRLNMADECMNVERRLYVKELKRRANES